MIDAVPASGSKSVALDVGPTLDFPGQFNINYNSEDGSQQQYLSPLFTVIHHVGIISPEIWNQQALFTTSLVSHARSTDTSEITSIFRSASTSTGTSTTSNPSRHLAAASTIALTTSATTSASASITAPKTYHQSPSSASVIGLSIGITFGIAAVCLVGFLYWVSKKKMPDRRRSHGMSQKPAPPLVSDARTRGEMDAYQKPLELPVSRLDTELDGGRPCR